MADALSTIGGATRGREPAPWVLVAGGFHRLGGMDKANAALAAYLLARGHRLHIVAHRVAPEFSTHPRVTVHHVARPGRSTLMGEQLLDVRGRAVARAVAARDARARVVVNGGNCLWPDINWVHCVHHAWPPSDEGAPTWFKAKNRLTSSLARRRERRAIQAARVVVANSERTRRDVIGHLGLAPERVHAVSLGGDPAPAAATPEEREAARRRLGMPGRRPLVAFVGALGHDHNKGFDTLLRAWASLCSRAGWDADLVVAGGGRGVGGWRARVAAGGMEGCVRLLGFTEGVEDVYAAADLLVSPARYEAYGLNVREAVSRGTPALVSGRAGVAEHYTPELREMVLPDPEDAADLAARLLRWRSDIEGWKGRFAPLSAKLRERTWEDMAAEFVSLVEGEAGAQAAGREAYACTA